LALALLLALTIPYMPHDCPVATVGAPGESDGILWRYCLPHVPMRLSHPSLPKLRPLPHGVPAEALVLDMPEGYQYLWAGPAELSLWQRALGCKEGYKAHYWNDGVALYSVAFVFWDADGAHWYLRQLAEVAAEEGLEEVACPLEGAEVIGHQRDMGNGVGYLITFRLGNLVCGVVLTVANGIDADGAILAYELAQEALRQAWAAVQ